MTTQKFKNIVSAIFMILCAVSLIFFPDQGFYIVVFILALSITIKGLRQLIYYFMMAKNMVGGQQILFTGIIYFDFGLFVLTLNDVPKQYVMLYLLGSLLVRGVIHGAGAFQSIKLKADAWKGQMLHAVVNIVVAIFGLFMLNNETLIIYVYCCGLGYSAISRIIQTFKTREIVYIQ